MKKQPIRWMAAVVLAACLACVANAQPSAAAPPADLVQQAALEAAGQDMVETQLAGLIVRFEDLIQDLASNRNVAAEVSAITGTLRDRLATIKQVRLKHARKLIDEAMQRPGSAATRLSEAQKQIELAARELGSLLLQAGVSHACEVFATELRETIARQESIQAAVSGGGAAARETAPKQQALAEDVEKLVAELRSLRESPADALAAVRLARARKIVEAEHVAVAMHQAAEEIVSGRSSAADRQVQALKGLRQSLLKLRPDARLEELVRARNLLKELLDAQKALQTSLASLTAEELAQQGMAARLRQEAIVRPVRQLDGALEIDAFTGAADKAGQDAAAALGSGNRAVAAEAQARVEAALASAVVKLGDQIAKLSALGVTHKRMLESAERLKAINEIRDRAEQIKNAAFEAATAGKGMEGEATAQTLLGKEIAAMAEGMPTTSRFAAAMRRPLRKTSQAAERAAVALKANKLDAAMPEFSKAEQTLTEALNIAKRELGLLEKLWLFQQASADLKQIRMTIEDLEAEQGDLRTDTESARKEGRTVLDLTGPQTMLTRATQQVQDSVSAIHEAAPMKEPLDAALAAMNEAAGHLEKDRADTAMNSQKQAIAALHNGRQVAGQLISQIDLIVVEIDAAAELSSRAMDLLERQIVLREETEDAGAASFPRLAGEQDIIRAECAVLATLSVAPKAAEAFKAATDEMTAAIGQLKAGAREQAVEHQKKAEEALRAGILALDDYIRSLMAMLQSQSMLIKQYITAFDGLTALLLLATEQRELRELTYRSPDVVLPTYAEKQTELHTRCIAVSKMPDILTLEGRINGWEHIEAAAKEMDQALGTLKKSAKNESVEHQQVAEKELRTAFAMNVVELITALTPPPPPKGKMVIPVMKDIPVPFSLEHWSEFTKASPTGKINQGGKAEWSSLMDRERAALNENFARELPLEFRKLLKDYYEALAK